MYIYQSVNRSTRLLCKGREPQKVVGAHPWQTPCRKDAPIYRKPTVLFVSLGSSNSGDTYPTCPHAHVIHMRILHKQAVKPDFFFSRFEHPTRHTHEIYVDFISWTWVIRQKTVYRGDNRRRYTRAGVCAVILLRLELPLRGASFGGYYPIYRQLGRKMKA